MGVSPILTDVRRIRFFNVAVLARSIALGKGLDGVLDAICIAS